MGRWKPPPVASSPYITQAGYIVLQEELKGLWGRRATVVKALAAAAAEGDRSENAEYIYRKKELGGLDRRIRYLQKRLPDLKIVDTTTPRDGVYFGAWVSLERDDGKELQYRIVGPDEADGSKNSISLDSPLAKALMKRTVDEDVKLTIDGITSTYLLTAISYESQ